MYNWELDTTSTRYKGEASTLHEAIDSLVHYSYGKDERDFYVNKHHMNQEFDLWISGGKVVHDDGSEFVPTNRWYELLGGQPPVPTYSRVLETLGRANMDFDRIFRPQPTRGAAPSNPANLLAKGEAL